MSNAYGAGSPQAGLNAPGGMPSWLQNLWSYVNPMTAATAGGVDAQGRPQDAVTAAQQALAAQAMNGGPQASGPIAGSQAGNVSTAGIPGAAPTPPVMRAALTRAPIVGGGGDDGGGGASGVYPDPSIAARTNAMNHVAAYTGAAAPIDPYGPTRVAAPITPYDQRAPISAANGGRAITVNPHARQQAQVAAAAPAVPQVPWIKTDFRQNLPAGNGPLGRNAQTQQGMIDFSKLFNRGS